MARIWYVGSLANAIDTHHVGLILDGTGAEKSIPLEHPGSGPIGDIDYCVVVGTLRSAPDGETQIVAYENKETDALDIDHDPLGAGIVGLGLAAHGEEVSLVGDGERAVGMATVKRLKKRPPWETRTEPARWARSDMAVSVIHWVTRMPVSASAGRGFSMKPVANISGRT